MTACSGPLVGTRPTARPSRDLRPPAYPPADHPTPTNQAASTVRPAREHSSPQPGRSGRTASCSSSVTSLLHHQELFRRPPVTPGATSLWGGDQRAPGVAHQGTPGHQEPAAAAVDGTSVPGLAVAATEAGSEPPASSAGSVRVAPFVRFESASGDQPASPSRPAPVAPRSGARMARGPGASSNGRRLPPPLPRGRGPSGGSHLMPVATAAP